MAVHGELCEQRDRIRDECEHVREDQRIEEGPLPGKRSRSIITSFDDQDVILRFDCGADQLTRPAAEVHDDESSVIAATRIEKRSDLG